MPGHDASRPRVAHVIPRLQLRGAEVFAEQLAAAQSGRYEPAVFLLEDGRGALRASVTAFDPALIVAHGGEPMRAVARARLDRLAPVIYVRVSSVPVRARGGIRGRVLRAAYSRAAVCVAVSRSLADELAGMGVPAEHIVVIPNGRAAPDDLAPERRRELRREMGALDDERLVVWVGGLVPEKDPAALARVAELVRASDSTVRFAAIGDGPLALALTEADLRLLPPRPDAAACIAAADLLLSTSVTEGQPGVIVEALLAGTPVVAPAVGGIPELLSAEAGVLVSPGDARALADAVRELCDDDDRRIALGRGAHALGMRHEIGAVAALYDELFERVLTRN